MQYHIIMIDYGRGPRLPMGLEALPVQPELTRREIIEQVRDVLACDHRSLVHVKFIDGNYCEDRTAEICEAAGYPDAPLSPVDRQEAAWDHARALRKEFLR